MAYSTKIEAAESFIFLHFGYDIANSQFTREAITTGQTNKRIAHVGDAAIETVIRLHGYHAGLSRGQTVELAQSFVRNDRLAAFACNIGLEQILILNPGHFGAVSNLVLATSLEAVFGAIYLDSGESNDAVRDAMRAIGMMLGAANNG